MTYVVFRVSNLELDDSRALFMGTIWLGLTIAFEFVAGHYVFGNPWEKLLVDYNLLEGRIWSLVLLTIFLMPYIINKPR